MNPEIAVLPCSFFSELVNVLMTNVIVSDSASRSASSSSQVINKLVQSVRSSKTADDKNLDAILMDAAWEVCPYRPGPELIGCLMKLVNINLLPWPPAEIAEAAKNAR